MHSDGDSASAPKTARTWRVLMMLGLLAGTALLIGLLLRYQFRDILQALATAGWALGAILIIHAIYFWLDMRAWQALLPRELRTGRLYKIGWIGESVGIRAERQQGLHAGVDAPHERARLGTLVGACCRRADQQADQQPRAPPATRHPHALPAAAAVSFSQAEVQPAPANGDERRDATPAGPAGRHWEPRGSPVPARCIDSR